MGRAQVAENYALIGKKEPLSCLVTEFSEDPVYKSKSERLCGLYSSLRRVRPDGNCFFRGFGFSYFEQLLADEGQWRSFQTLVAATKDQLLAQGFPKFTLEDFYDSVRRRSTPLPPPPPRNHLWNCCIEVFSSIQFFDIYDWDERGRMERDWFMFNSLVAAQTL